MKGKFILHFLLLIVALTLLQSYSTFEKKEPEPYDLKYDSETLGEPDIPKSNPLTVEGVRLGRMLFYDPLLSGNNKMSCSSCHKQELAFTDGKKLAIGTYGDTLDRHTMSLINLAWGTEFFWNGRAKSLESLVVEPITKGIEMGQDTLELIYELESTKHYPSLFQQAFPEDSISIRTVSMAISQFLRSIVSNGVSTDYLMEAGLSNNMSKRFVELNELDSEESMTGLFIRLSKMCNPCHGGPIYGNQLMARNGLQENPMKVPSLMNILNSPPYMHDGRFDNLSSVLLHYDSVYSRLKGLNPTIKGLPEYSTLTEYDLKNAQTFFSLLQDSSLLRNEEYANPF
jgi:cytochrome c peroxidase